MVQEAGAPCRSSLMRALRQGFSATKEAEFPRSLAPDPTFDDDFRFTPSQGLIRSLPRREGRWKSGRLTRVGPAAGVKARRGMTRPTGSTVQQYEELALE